MARAQALLELTAALAAAVDAADLGAVPDGSLVELLGLAGQVRRSLDAVASELANAVEARSQGDDSLARRFGEKSPAALVSRIVGIELDEARDWCAVGAIGTPQTTLLGEELPLRYPATADAIAGGRLCVRAARVVVDTLDALETIAARAPVNAPTDLADIERALVDVAPTLSLRDLRRLCTQVIDRANPDGVEPREDELRAKSGLQIVNRRDGLVQWIVTMHPEAAGFAAAALDARTAPRRTLTFRDEALPQVAVDEAIEADDRTLAHTRLDAFADIMRDSLAHDDGEVAGTAVTMVIKIDYHDLITGIGAATIEGIDTPISVATARRLACDAEIIPAVFGGPAEPLQLGRAQRLFSRAQRRAIALRDGGCTWPGCPAPPGWCEIAHIVAWYAGGLTDIDNGLMLCPFHHRRFDNDGWEFERHNGVPSFIPPAWLDATRTPRRGGRIDADLLIASG